MFMLFVGLYVSIFIPYRMALEKHPEWDIIILDFVLDFIYLTDIGITFFTPYNDRKKGQLVKTKK